MSTAKLRSWSPPADAASALVLAALACAVFAASWTLLHVGVWARDQIVDTPVHQEYGDRIEDGDVPYRDFRPEYPPGALVAFVVPSLLSGDGDFGAYVNVFELVMLACGLALVVGVALARGSPAALAFVALSPLA